MRGRERKVEREREQRRKRERDSVWLMESKREGESRKERSERV